MTLLGAAVKYLKRYSATAWFVMATIILQSLFEGVSFGMLIPVIQRMTTDQGSVFAKIPVVKDHWAGVLKPMDELLMLFIVMFIFIVLKNIFVYISNLYTTKLRLMVVRDLGVRIMDNVLGYDMKYVDTVRSGHIIGAVNVETLRVGELVQAMLQFITYAAKITAYVAVLFLISWQSSIAVFILMAIVFIPLEVLMRAIKRLGASISRAISDSNHYLHEILGGFRLIRMFGTEDAERKRFGAAQQAVYSSSYNGAKSINLIVPLSEVLILGLVIVLFAAVTRAVTVSVEGLFPLLATYLVVLTKMLTQLNSMNGVRSKALNNLAAVSVCEEMCVPEGKKAIKDGTRDIAKFSDMICFQKVLFCYRPGIYVLKDIDLVIPKGKTLALVGESGAGKSTLVNLITRLYDFTEGEITVDGIPLKDLKMRAWRNKIGFVSQDTFIFNASVRANIAYGSVSASAEDVTAASRAANAHEFITELPQGYDTVLGERGVTLSGGQKQRLSIARAILHNPEILIMDEATSSLDTETEKLITQAIARLTEGRTVIAIAHRLSTILHADSIVVLQKGSVAEQGTHAELIGRGMIYKRLYDTQFS